MRENSNLGIILGFLLVVATIFWFLNGKTLFS